MAGKAIQRALLIITLIVTAHVLKPFSIRSMTKHLLHSANSFSLVLPDSALGSLEKADYLARVLDGSFHHTDWPKAGGWSSYTVAEAKLSVVPQHQGICKAVSIAPAAVATKRGSLAKSTSPRAKGREIACRVKAAPEPVVLDLPVSHAIEKTVALQLPVSDIAWVQAHSEALSKRAEALSKHIAARRLPPPPQTSKCEPPERLEVKLVVLSDEAQQRLKESLQRLLTSASPTRAVYVRSTRSQRAAGQLKCS